MCGIAGYCGRNAIDDARVERCLALMGRRGPDATGVFRHRHPSGRQVCLLHSRLSIIDLDRRADQPMARGDGVLVFNGELYNYSQLRPGLERQGQTFATSGDSEVLLAALNVFGSDALDRFEGMWAFAWYDRARGELLLCRDRFGEKPLYLYRDDGGLYFGSEVKFLAALAGRAFSFNRRQVRRFLVNGYKALYKTGEGFFEEVGEVAPGHALRLAADGTPSDFSYYDRAVAENPDMTEAQAVAGAREALIRSVGLRLGADAPLAFCMSGGVDSNALIGIAKNVFGYDVHGFTIVNADNRYAEQELVDQAVAELGIRHTAIELRHDGFLDNLRRLVRHHDAPVYTITYYVHWLLMQSVAAAGYRVCVSGTAADELFSGYYDHHAMYLAAVADDPALFATSLANWNAHIRPIVRNPLLQDPLAFVKNPEQREHIYLDADVFAARLTEPFAEPFMERRMHATLLRNRMLNELFYEAVPVILHEDDLNAMYYSVENRSPFLDRELYEFCGSIPTRHLIGDGYNKKVLRDALRGLVPGAILDSRRKVGFNAPVRSLLDLASPAVRAILLEDSPIFEIVRRDSIEALCRCEAFPNSESKFLFSFLSAKFFLEAFA